MYYFCLHTINTEVTYVGKLPPLWKSELSKCFFLRAVGDYLAYLIHFFQRVFNLRFLL